MPKNRIVLAMNISRMALWKIEQRYKKDGEYGLKDHKPGRLFAPLSPKFYKLVIKEWKKNKCGARKLHVILKGWDLVFLYVRLVKFLLKKASRKPFLKGRSQENTKGMNGQSQIICGILIGMLLNPRNLKGRILSSTLTIAQEGLWVIVLER